MRGVQGQTHGSLLLQLAGKCGITDTEEDVLYVNQQPVSGAVCPCSVLAVSMYVNPVNNRVSQDRI